MSFDRWHSADPDAVGSDNNEPPDPGFYDVVLADGGAFVSKEKQEDWVKLVWRQVGADPDSDWTVLLGFRSQAAANFTKREVRELGVNVDEVSSMSELDDAVKRMLGCYYEVEVVQNGEFRNTYIRGKQTAGPQADLPVDTDDVVPAAAGAADDDDIPF